MKICKTPNSVKEILETVNEHGVVLYRGEQQNKDWFVNMMANTKLSRRELSHEQGKPHILSTSTTEDVITGPFPLPFHTDGVLSEKTVHVILLYCEEVNARGGQTILVPIPEVEGLISTGVFEYLCLDRGYYSASPDGWFTIPTRKSSRTGKLCLNIALPFIGEFLVSKPSWRVRLPGKSENESLGYFSDLWQRIRVADGFYVHEWKKGDLLVLDNERVLHGRLPFNGGDERRLIREQFVL